MNSTLCCIVCGGKQFETVYCGAIRAGSYGKITEDVHEVVECNGCGFRHLKEFVQMNYETDSYRENYNDSAEVEDYMSTHTPEQELRLKRIGLNRFREKKVLDFGCGGGAFLDAVKDVAHATIGIEPMTSFHSSLLERGHQVVASAADPDLTDGMADVVVSFGVIEHVEDPLAHLFDIHRFLTPGGVAFLETDNLKEILMCLALPEFERFFYRTAHAWYFSSGTLETLCHKAGFATVLPGHRHGYDLSNFILWLRDREPTGIGRLQLLSGASDNEWKASLERAGLADLLLFELAKD